MKSIKDILYSPRFLREVSQLLFFFAAFSALIGFGTLMAADSQLELLAVAIGGILQAIIYTVLAIFIRRGSTVALWIAGVLFLLDTILQLLHPTPALVGRGLLIYILIRYVRQARKEA